MTNPNPKKAVSTSRDTASPLSLFESLEPREMMTVSIATPIPDTTTQRGAGAITIDVAGRYTDPAFNNIVRFVTNLGNVDIELNPGVAPNTVANFLNYVNSGRYDSTIFHRLTAVSNSGIGVLQGGGFTRPTADLTAVGTPSAGIPSQVVTDAPIVRENPTGNVQWTIAMARLGPAQGQPETDATRNSATSQFFFNMVNNSTALDLNGNVAGYAVFGTVTTASRAVLQQLYTQGATNVLNNQWDISGAFGNSPIRGAFSTTPLISTFNGNFPIRTTDYLSINRAQANGVATYLASSSNTNIATASIVNGRLVVTPVAGAVGQANITVRATGIDGSIVEDTFQLEITSAAPTAQAFQARDDWAIGRNMPVFLAGVRDTDSAVSRVDFYRDTNNNGQYDDGTDIQLASDNTAADGFFASLPTGSFTVGDNTIFARIVDSDGAATVVTQVVTMREAPAAPTVTPSTNSVAPGEGFSLDIGSNLGADDVRRVQVFLDVNNNSGLDRLGDDRLLGTASFNAGTGNWVFDGNASQLSLGANRLFIRVQDVFGNLSAATAITITLA